MVMVLAPKEQYKKKHLLNIDLKRWKFDMYVEFFNEYELKYLTILDSKKIL